MAKPRSRRAQNPEPLSLASGSLLFPSQTPTVTRPWDRVENTVDVILSKPWLVLDLLEHLSNAQPQFVAFPIGLSSPSGFQDISLDSKSALMRLICSLTLSSISFRYLKLKDNLIISSRCQWTEFFNKLFHPVEEQIQDSRTLCSLFYFLMNEVVSERLQEFIGPLILDTLASAMFLVDARIIKIPHYCVYILYVFDKLMIWWWKPLSISFAG